MEGLAVQPACDNCRRRKTRCDRGSPCSPCRAASLTCRTESQRTKVHTRRVQVSKQYEDKIDSIDQRLANIEHLLRQSNSNQSSPHTQTHSESASSRVRDVAVSEAVAAARLSNSEDNSGSDTPAALTAATSVLEQTIGRDTDLQQDLDLTLALTSLRGVVNHSQTGADSSARGTVESPSSDFVYPEWDQVRAVLHRAEIAKPMMFNLYSHAMFENFLQRCRSMYEQGCDGSPTDKLLVYSGLANVCAEFTVETDDLSASYNHGLQQAFSWLLMKTLTAFPLLVPASLETLEALLLAALTTIGMCKPSLAWSLICKAAQMSQKLGYNRLASSSSSVDPQYNRKVLLFWSVYAIDRNISFRLGQTPFIQDYDIDTPVVLKNDERHVSAREFLTFWVDCGRIQGKACTQLYGPAASLVTEEYRARLAENLANELEAVYQRKCQANANAMAALSHSTHTEHTDAWVHSDGINYYSTLATILYAIPSSQPSHVLAIDAARQCLRLSRDLSNRYFHNVYNWTSCCHWVLLHAPLTAFTGVFYAIIADPYTSGEDLQLLEDFVISLEPARRFSDSIEKFYQLCLAFVKVARAYLRAKTQQQPPRAGHTAPQAAARTWRPTIETHGEADAAIGQMAVTDFEHQQQQFVDVSQSFQEWYTGNASLYGLLEQDFDDASFDMLGGS